MKCTDLQSLTQEQYQRIYKKQLGAVAVHSSSSHGDVTYTVTNRGFTYLADKTFPNHWTRELKPGMTVLDIGTGLGALVEDLRQQGIDAHGIDIHEQLPKRTYFKTLPFEQSDYPRQSFDRVLSSYSIFYYPESRAFLKKALEKIAEILKLGGKAQLAPVLDAEQLKSVLEEVPTLEVSEEGPENKYMELLKTPPRGSLDIL